MQNATVTAQPSAAACRRLLYAIRDALVIPLPTTDRDELAYLRLCRDRAWLVLAACGRILGDHEAGDRDLLMAAEALRYEAADYPPDNYVHQPPQA
jgi:hypothetical protein